MSKCPPKPKAKAPPKNLGGRPLTPEKYKNERKKRGTQTEVAQRLKVHRDTIAKREGGTTPITREAWLALVSLPVRDSN
jgi:DNA-binding XRE family transcriptional regulator